jgi:hypothetical protein
LQTLAVVVLVVAGQTTLTELDQTLPMQAAEVALL